MDCPECNAWSTVLETRQRAGGVYRRHECANLHRFSTLNGEAVIGLQRAANIRKTLLTILREAKFPLMTAQVRDRLARRVKQDVPTKLVLRHLNALAEIGSATKGKKSPREVHWRFNAKAR